MSTSGRLRAIRGAITVPRDDPGEVVDATEELLRAMLERNRLRGEDVISIIFTATPDLRSQFPAPAARRLGLAEVPLLCAAEIDVEGALPRCVRILLHVETDADRAALRHVYLRDARALRADLDAGAEDDPEVKGHRSNPQGEVE